jgi:hypothetical protein
MPRVRRTRSNAPRESIPVVLLDSGDRLWRSRKLTRAWLDEQGLRIGVALDWGPLNRHEASMFAWARSAGILLVPSPNGFVGFDVERMREMGLPATGGRGTTEERLLSVGVSTSLRW